MIPKPLLKPAWMVLLLGVAGGLAAPRARAADTWTLSLGASGNWEAVSWNKNGAPAAGAFPNAADDIVRLSFTAGSLALYLQNNRTVGLLEANQGNVYLRGGASAANGSYTLSAAQININAGVFSMGHRTAGSSDITVHAGLVNVSGGNLSFGSHDLSGATYVKEWTSGTLAISAGRTAGVRNPGFTKIDLGAVQNNGTLDLAWKSVGTGSSLFTSGNPYTVEAGSLTGNGLVTTTIDATGMAPRPTLWIKGTNAAGAVYDGLIEDGAAASKLAVHKSGSGFQRFSRAEGNTYSGGTVISGGVLAGRNTSGSAFGSGSVLVEAGGTMATSYRMRLEPGAEQSITVENGGTFNAGYDGTPAIAVTTISGASNGSAPVLSMESGSAFAFRLDTVGGGADLIRFESYTVGDLLLADALVNITGLDELSAPQSWKLFDFDGDISTEAWFGNGLQLGSGFGSYEAEFLYEANAIYLHVVPEPGSILLGAFGAGLLLVRRWGRRRACTASVAMAAAFATPAGAQEGEALTLARDGKTAYTLLIPKNAPASLVAAAAELRRNFTEATGAEISLQDDSEGGSRDGPVISLGATSLAREAGVSAEGVADDGFRIVTRGENLFILGPDTGEGEWTKMGGTSQGTANGVYTFLEDTLGVRWLMPGELGRDVPKHTEVKFAPLDRKEAPEFIWRLMSHIYDYSRDEVRAKIDQWAAHQKLGSSIRYEYNHNWEWVAEEPDAFKKHPEWFAMIDGARKRPRDKYVKLETTDPNLVRHFADRAISTLKADSRPNTFSLSPSDSRGWSESAESKALYDPPFVAEGMELVDPTEAAQRLNYPGMSSLVLKWYHDVASLVAKEYPEGRLAGFLYGDYVWPPQQAEMKLPANFTPVLCGPNYGFLLYGEVYRKRFREVIRAWSAVAPDIWFYYDLPNQFFQQSLVRSDARFPGGCAIVTPPGIEILDTISTELVAARIKGAYLFSESTWGNSALANYLNAKLLWNPRLKAGPLQAEWLRRAYGPQAGEAMERFYTRLEAIYRDYARNHSITGRLTPAFLRDLYAANFPELEALFGEAASQPMTERQKARLGLIKENLAVLRWRLVNGGMLPAGQSGPLVASDKEVAAWVESAPEDFHRFPGVLPLTGAKTLPRFSGVAARKVTVEPPKGDAAPGLSLAGVMPKERHSFLLHLERDGALRITPARVHHDLFFGVVLIFKRGEKEPVLSRLLIEGEPLEVSGKAGDDFLVVIPQRGPVAAELKVEGAVAAKGRFDSRSATLRLSAPEGRAVYVYEHSGDVLQQGGDVLLRAGAFPAEMLKRELANARELGLEEGWSFRPGVAGGSAPASGGAEWKPVQVGEPWQKQGFAGHIGTGWYENRFTLPTSGPVAKALLYFEAVDGNAEVWLNGRRLGEHRLGAGYSGWNLPFYLDATAALRPGENRLLVRVEKDIEVSGVTGGVKLLWSDQ